MNGMPQNHRQTHRMRWVFWITLPILAGSMLLAFALGKSDKIQSESPTQNFLDILISNDVFPAILISLLVLTMLWLAKLDWKLNEKGIEFRYFPFIIRKKHLPWSEIVALEYIKINPLRDFGGWGLRYSRKLGKAYTTSGNHVLRIQIRDQKTIHLTANSHPELDSWLQYHKEVSDSKRA